MNIIIWVVVGVVVIGVLGALVYLVRECNRVADEATREFEGE